MNNNNGGNGWLVKSARFRFSQIFGWFSIGIVTFVSLVSCAVIIKPDNATAPILKTRVFIHGGGEISSFEKVNFRVPVAGTAILSAVNAARVGASPVERLAGAEISLNGRRIVSFDTFGKQADVLRRRVRLNAGDNQLEVRVRGEPGKRLAVRIDAPADEIRLGAIADSLVLGETLHASAALTGLGRPVRNGRIEFSVSGFDDIDRRVATTGATGIARTTLSGFRSAGAGILTATAAEPRLKLTEAIPISVLQSRAIVLEQQRRSLRLETGSSALVDAILDVRSVQGISDRVTIESVVNPQSDGLSVIHGVPEEGLEVAVPRRIPISTKVSATVPGAYVVTTIARIVAKGEVSRVDWPVEVVAPGTPDRLLLGNPVAEPTGIAPGEPVRVTFRAQIDGTSTPPDVLFLDELDFAGKPVRRSVATLRDDGKLADSVARDRIYSGTYRVKRPASELGFRVSAMYFGSEIVSGITTFLVTPYAGATDPDPEEPVKTPGSVSRVIPNQIEIQVIAGTPPEIIREIAAAVAGRVVGVIPPLRIYLLEFPGDGGLKGVKEAINEVSAFAQVESAAPNFEMTYTAISFNTPPPCPATDPASCPDDGSQQWYLATIEARQAWELAGGGSVGAKVAVIDGGVNCGHNDLNGRCSASGNDAHATQVAGIISANANNDRGIAGIAWNTELESIAQGVGDGNAFKNAMTMIIGDVKVLNISQKVLLNDTNAIAYIRDGVCHAVDAGKLVVVAAGNLVSESDEDLIYPAKLNNESGYTCPSSSRFMETQLLAVGASNQSDARAAWVSGSINLLSSDAAYLDIYAPGVDILTTTSPVGVASVSGTSFATAQVAGAATVLWNHGAFIEPPGETRAKAVHDQLKATADPTPSICSNCKRLNIHAAVNVPTVSGPVAEFDPTGDVRLTAILGPQRAWAQTFRPVSNSPVTRVGLVLVADTNPPPAALGDLTIQIRTTTATGLPSPTVLGSMTIPGAMIESNNRLFDGTFTQHTLSAPVSLTAGELYAIVATTNSAVIDSPFGPYKWSGDHSVNPYADGTGFVRDDTPDSANPGIWDDKGGTTDLGFRVIAGP